MLPEIYHGCRDRRMVINHYNILLDENCITVPDKLVRAFSFPD